MVRRLRRLGQRREAGLVLLEGPRVIGEALACGVDLELLAVREGEAFEMPARRLVTLSERVFRSVSRTVSPQGVLAVGRRDLTTVEAALALAQAARWPLVVLDGVQDPGNVGAICRTAAAAGAPSVAVLGSTADPLGPKAVRASAGHVFRLAVARGDWSDLDGLDAVGAAAEGEPMAEVALESVVLLAFGSEAHGLSRGDLRLVAVPMAEGIDSLNVAAAAALLLYEVRRRRAA